MKISYSFGMIDLLHFGHINALRLAAADADLSVFGLVSDEAADAWFGSHVSNEEERRDVLLSIRYVDRVMPQQTFDPIDNLRALHAEFPDAVITLYHGNDFGVIPAKRYLETIGGSVVTFDYYEKLSPKKILETLNREVKPGRQFSNLISTKANTLLSLQKLITKARVEDIYVTTAGEYRHTPEAVAQAVADTFGGDPVVVRSSSVREDAFEESNAGHFKSIIGTPSEDKDAVLAAVGEVLASYGEDAGEEEQILIQRQTQGVRISGVIFTRDIQRNRPYYVINYDETGSTDAVTSGEGGSAVWMIHSIETGHIPEKWAPLMAAVREIEEILTGMLLDIEFALTDTGVVIFQVRPLAAAYRFGRRSGTGELEQVRGEAMERYEKRRAAGCTGYSDMAFWNPAEMIGDNPKNLDYSLYRRIITRRAWNEGIAALGYRRVEHELMERFGNKPYISLEYSFEALIPASVPDALAAKLVAYDMKKLQADLSAHDKIEFEISVNCYDFGTEKRLAAMEAEGFSPEETGILGTALRELTTHVIAGYPEILAANDRDLDELEQIRLEIRSVTGEDADHRFLSRSLRTLLTAIARCGTPQFSGQARCAFMAKSLIRSLESEGYVTPQESLAFLSSIRTVAVELDADVRAFLAGTLPADEFCSRYGHLRAGTYNIRSPRYDRQIRELFGERKAAPGNGPQEEAAPDTAALDAVLTAALERAMTEHDFRPASAAEVISFIRQATAERERFKFRFTKSLSDAIELIRRLGALAGIRDRDLSYLELPELFAAEYYTDIDRLREFWSLIIGRRRELYRINSELILPSVILSDRDLDYIENPVARPNFITEKKVSAPVVSLDEGEAGSEITGCIVCIEKADPGYDWIFSRGIAGLVTKYGGAASHMAIRCAEFEIPAAIGCGGRIYDQVCRAQTLQLDCKHERIRPVNAAQTGGDR